MGRVSKLSTTLLAKVALAVALSTACLGYLWVSSEYRHFSVRADQLKDDLVEERRDGLRRAVDDVVAYIAYMRAQTRARAMDTVRARVLQAHQIASHLVQQYQGSLPRPELEELVREALRPIRFDSGRGYYFAGRLDGVEMLFPDRPELEGQSLLDMRDSGGKWVIRDLIALTREQGEGFFEYAWTKPDAGGDDFRKVSYVKHFAPFDWFLGTGEYLDDMEAEIQQEVLRRIAEIKVDLTEADGYVFVGQWDGVSLSYPAKGKPMYDVQDANGLYIVRELIAVATLGSGFVEYVMPKLGGERPPPKLSYVVGVPEWRWYIGTGAYLDDIDGVYQKARAENEQRALHTIRTILFLFALALLAGLGLALWPVRRALAELGAFTAFFRGAATSAAPLPPDQLSFREFRELAMMANAMIAARGEVLDRLAASE